MKPVAWYIENNYYESLEEAQFFCDNKAQLEEQVTPLYTADQLREAQVKVAWLFDTGDGKYWYDTNQPFGRPVFAVSLPEPAPRLPEGCMWAVTKGGHSICQPPKSFYQKCAAPSSEEVREMVERLQKGRRVHSPEWHQAQIDAALIERLTFREKK